MNSSLKPTGQVRKRCRITDFSERGVPAWQHISICIYIPVRHQAHHSRITNKNVSFSVQTPQEGKPSHAETVWKSVWKFTAAVQPDEPQDKLVSLWEAMARCGPQLVICHSCFPKLSLYTYLSGGITCSPSQKNGVTTAHIKQVMWSDQCPKIRMADPSAKCRFFFTI